MEQAVKCAPVTQRTRVRSPVGTSFLGGVFSVVFPHLLDKCRKLYHHKVLEYILAVIILL